MSSIDYEDYLDPRVLSEAEYRLVRTMPTKTALQWHERMTNAERESANLAGEVLDLATQNDELRALAKMLASRLGDASAWSYLTEDERAEYVRLTQ